MSMRYKGAINKPGFNPLAAPSPTYIYNLFSFGLNGNGQLGLGNTTNYSSPKQVGSLYWNAIAAGNNNTSFGIKTDGTLWSWGMDKVGL
jgi:alpha-tubulin suppressor-like RCC1 family protein